MTPLTLKLQALPRRAAPRAEGAVRQALALLSHQEAFDAIREPAGLAQPMSPRARRLMRSARITGG